MSTATMTRSLTMAALAVLAGNTRIFNGPSTDIDELRETVDALTLRVRHFNNQCKSIQGRADAEKRDLTAAEATKFDSLMAQFDATERELKAARTELVVAEAEDLDSTPQARRTAPNPVAGASPTPRRSTRRAGPIGQRTAAFSDVFAGHQLDDPYADRFDSLGEFALAIAMGGRDSRLVTNATMTTTEGGTGGFLMPLQYFGAVLDAALQQEVVRPRATVLPMSTKQAAAPVFDYADGTGSKRAGLQLLWGPEATALTEQRGKVREVTLNAHKANIFVRVSSELASDVPMFDRQLSAAMVAAVAAGLDAVFLTTGTGAGQPLSVLGGSNTITVSKETQAADTILLQNLVKMVGRLAPASFAQAEWFVHPTAVPQLYLMSYTVQNVAGTENVGGTAAQAITIDGSGQLRIFGRPVVITEACAVVGDKGDIVLADLSKYIVGLRADAVIAKDESRYFDSDEIAFKLTLRVDGQPADREARKLKDGTNTVGPFVVLEAR